MQRWQLTTPIDGILFDCDSTLSSIEGITELAKMHHVYESVYQLTEEAMAKTGINERMYQDRLQLVQPVEQELLEVADIYWNERTPDVKEVVHILQACGKQVFVVSAGIQQSVEKFAQMLGIPEAHVFAVPVYFDEQGKYKDFDQKSPLATTTGKSDIVKKLRKTNERLALVGDGMNDIEASQVVDRFIGYGGNCYRAQIAKLSEFYIKAHSMTPVLPLVLTAEEAKTLPAGAKEYYQQGLMLIEDAQVELNFKE